MSYSMRLIYNLIVLILLINSHLLIALTDEQLNTWIMPSPQEQLDREAKRELVGLGRVFVPAMSQPEYEPFYMVQGVDDHRQYFAQMGESTYLRPGEYILQYGSGNESQMMSKRISVIREYVHIVEPDWGGLRVRLIDENRNTIDTQYELFAMKNAESYGFGIGSLEEFGEQPQTWILRPGRYKIVLNNKPFNTIDDFTTVDLAEGELRILTIVVDSDTDSLIGAGILETAEYARERSNLRFTSAIHGNLNFNMDNTTDRERPALNLIVTTQLDNRLIFDRFPYFYSMQNLTDFGLSKDRDSDLRVSTDNFQIRNTFVYYLSQLFGLYGRFDMETHFFEQFEHASDSLNVRIVDSEGQIINEQTGLEKFRITPSIYPLIFREGAGFSIRPINRPRSTVNLRFGFGMQQDINNRVYRYERTVTDTINTEIEYSVYREAESTYKEGIEMSLLANFFTPYNISYNTALDVLIPFDTSVSNTYRWENTFTFRFVRHMALDYKINLLYDKDRRDYTEVIHNVFLRLTYLIY